MANKLLKRSSEHWVLYRIFESLYDMLETNIILYIKLKEKEKTKRVKSLLGSQPLPLTLPLAKPVQPFSCPHIALVWFTRSSSLPPDLKPKESSKSALPSFPPSVTSSWSLLLTLPQKYESCSLLLTPFFRSSLCHSLTSNLKTPSKWSESLTSFW